VNIFILDRDPKVAARMQCDKHIVKMILESAQMMSTAHRIIDGYQERRPSKSGKTMVKYWKLLDEREFHMYKAVHVGHPCTVWTMNNDNNYTWHFDHFVELCREYTHRYGRVHETDRKLRKHLSHLPKNIKKGFKYATTAFPLAMQHEPQCMMECPVKSYRAYYKTKAAQFNMVWTKRETPEWFYDK
jgi:hypothetical protein